MTYDAFFKSVKTGELLPVYMFVGEENYIKSEAISRLREALLPDGLEALNEEIIEGGSAQQIIDSAETMPLMCDRRLVVVNDYPPMSSGRARDEQNELERMEAWMKSPPSTCVLVFRMSGSADSRKKMTSLIKKSAEVVEFNPLGDGDIYKWLNQTLKKQGKSIGREAAYELTFMAGRQLTTLSQELGKLAAYIGERTEITAGDVRDMVTPSTEARSYQMIGKLLDGKPSEARALLNAMLESGETYVNVLASITYQFRIMLHIKLMRGEGIPLSEIESRLSINKYAASSAARQAARLDTELIESFYRACVEADYEIKSGALRDEAAVEELLLSLGCAVGGK